MSGITTSIRRRVVTPIVETLFPSQCWASDAAILPEELGLSGEVREAIARGIEMPYCARCGMTTGPHTSNDRKTPCAACEERQVGVSLIARVGTFDRPLSELVKRLKFQRRWEIAPLIAPFVVQAIEKQTAKHGLRVDGLVPVALHWRRRFSRGFNQAEEISRAMGKLTGWKVVDCLRRVRATEEQSLTQSVHQRRENLDRAFEVRAGAKVAGMTLWLIDDVCTTGATIRAAALAFRRMEKGERPGRVCAGVVCVTDKGVRSAAAG